VYGSDRQVPESAQTATAILGGVKTNFNIVGLRDSVARADCHSQSSQGKAAEVDSIIRHAIKEGTNTGVSGVLTHSALHIYTQFC
jgi:alkaline phosphatase